MKATLLRNPVAIFLGRFALIFLILAFPWPGWNKAYGVSFRALARMFFVGDELRELSFEAQGENSRHPLSTRIVIVNRALMHPDGSGPVRNLDVGFDWQPTALLVALILATPIPWQRRGWALLWGLLCLYGLVLLLLNFLIWNESTEVSLVTLSPFWKHVANTVRDALAAQFDLAMPVLIWILVTFRRGDGFGNLGLLTTGKRNLAVCRPL